MMFLPHNLIATGKAMRTLPLIFITTLVGFRSCVASDKPNPSQNAPVGPGPSLLLLDVDNTLYDEKNANIESQIVRNTHKYCEDFLRMPKEQADELYQKHGSTVAGLLAADFWAPEHREAWLDHFYRVIYDSGDVQMNDLLPPAWISQSSTGYSHSSQTSVRQLLECSSVPVAIASNSPSWHTNRVLHALGMGNVKFENIFTPDAPGVDFTTTKHNPKAFFGDSLPPGDTVLLDDSSHILQRVTTTMTNLHGVKIDHDQSTLLDNLRRVYGLVDNSYEFSQVNYLKSKSPVDVAAMDSSIWNEVAGRLVQKAVASYQQKQETVVVDIVDVGAGLLSMLELFLFGNSDYNMSSVLDHLKSSNVPAMLRYTAYDSNRKLYGACHEQLLAWGFTLKQSNSDTELVYIHPSVELKLCLKDFDSEVEDAAQLASPPDLIVGRCFADLMHPSKLVPSLIRRFNLLSSASFAPPTLLYFPITFSGTTQFFPAHPFEQSASPTKPTIPSDTAAFNVYAEALQVDMGHNLDPMKLIDELQAYGSKLLQKGSSDWVIDPQANAYLHATMLYFFGTAAGPHLLARGWDAAGWLKRARTGALPQIRVSNLDLLFAIGGSTNHDKVHEKWQAEVTRNDPSMQEISFTAPQKVTSEMKEIPKELGPTQVLIKSEYSLISSGTELKIFNGLFDDASLDVNIKGMEDERMAYPLAYGYSLVGRIVRSGADVPTDLNGKLVFAFAAHASHVVADFNSIQVVPDGIDPQDAIFMPSVETALSLAHDAHVRIGEKVAIYGQGIIGLLLTAVLSMKSMDSLSGKFGTITAFDTIPDRIAASSRMGASQALSPGVSAEAGPFDVSIEVSGNARALQSAIDHTSDGGRIIVGSWYGNKDINLKLGIEFHRSHKTIQTSQVSELPASVSGLWDKPRRFALTWELVRQLKPSRLLTRTLSLDQAQLAYESLDRGKDIAVAFDYCQ